MRAAWSKVLLLMILLQTPAIGAAPWQTISHTLKPRAEASLVEYGGEVYLINGFTYGNKIQNSIEKYNFTRNQWTLVTTTSIADTSPTAVTHNGAVVVGDSIWLIGGRIGNHPGKVSNQVWIYNIPNNSWKKGPTLPKPFGGGGAAVLNNKIHVVGGFDTTVRCDVPNHFVYDLNNPQSGWKDLTAIAPLPEPRNHFGTVTLNNKLYVIGGQHGHDGPSCPSLPYTNGNLTLVHEYNPVTKQWKRMADLPVLRSHTEPSTFAYKGYIYVVGGTPRAANTVTRYNPIKNSWQNLDSMKLPLKLIAPGARIHNDKLYVFGGGAPWVYNPVTDTRVKTLDSVPELPDDSGDNNPPPQEPQDGYYTMTDGKIVIQAESYHGNNKGLANEWVKKRDGSTNTSFMVALPDAGKIHASSVAGSPALSYQVWIDTPGKYHIWVRARGDAVNGEGKSDSLHIGANGALQAGSDKIQGFGKSWSWRRTTRDQINAWLDMSSSGMQTVNLWMREDGLAVDKILLTRDAAYTPAGSGPDSTLVTKPASHNSAPEVDAGADLSTESNIPVRLAGAVTDDGKPGPSLSIRWSLKSGPANVVFSDATQAAPLVTFPAPGTYTLELKASDGELESVDRVVVTVTNNQNNPATLVVGPLEVDFGRIDAGTSKSVTLTLSNSGDEPLRITAVALQGRDPSVFRFDPVSRNSIPAGKTAQLKIHFSPTLSGTYSAVLAISHDTVDKLTLISLDGSARQADATPTSSTRYRINVGGPALPAVDGPGWEADTQANPSPYLASSANIYVNRSAAIVRDAESVPDYVPDSLFQSERWTGNTSSGLSWQFPVSAGEYQVRLYFAEIFPAAFSDGFRVLDIWLEGTRVKPGFDTYASAGGYTANVQTFTVQSDSQLDIVLKHVKQNPALKGIEIIPCTDACSADANSNQPPSVSAGPDQNVLLGQTVQMKGSVSDDGLPQGELHYQWSKIAGPAGVSFSETQELSPSVTFASAGQYVLQLSSSDTELRTSDRVTVIVTDQSSPASDFVERDGLVVIEAEHFSSKSAGTNHHWVNNVSGAASSGNFMVSTPDNGSIKHNTSGSPRLSYRVRFERSGRFYLWIRGKGDTNAGGEGKSDSLHAGIDGKLATSADKIDLFPAAWNWSSHTRDAIRASITVKSPGIHSIDMWMREDGLEVDKLLLTRDPGYIPQGAGPAETSLLPQ